MYRGALWQALCWHFGNAHGGAEWFNEEATIYSWNLTRKWSLNHWWCALGHGFDGNFVQYLPRVPYLSPCFMVGELSLKKSARTEEKWRQPWAMKGKEKWPKWIWTSETNGLKFMALSFWYEDKLFSMDLSPLTAYKQYWTNMHTKSRIGS